MWGEKPCKHSITGVSLPLLNNYTKSKAFLRETMETLYEVGSSDDVVNHSEGKRERTSPGEGRAYSA